MTVTENTRLTKMEESVEKISSDVSLIKSAIIGNSLTDDKGLVGEVNELKVEIELLKKGIVVLEKEAIENKQVILQLKFVWAAVITCICTIIVKHFL